VNPGDPSFEDNRRALVVLHEGNVRGESNDSSARNALKTRRRCTSANAAAALHCVILLFVCRLVGGGCPQVSAAGRTPPPRPAGWNHGILHGMGKKRRGGAGAGPDPDLMETTAGTRGSEASGDALERVDVRLKVRAYGLVVLSFGGA